MPPISKEVFDKAVNGKGKWSQSNNNVGNKGDQNGEGKNNEKGGKKGKGKGQ